MDQPIEVALFNFRVESAFIEWVKVMADMHEFGAVKYFAVTLAFYVRADESAHPIIVDYDRREDFQLTEGLQRNQCEEYKLFSDIESSFSIIRLREELRIMKPYIVYSQIFPTMNSKLI